MRRAAFALNFALATVTTLGGERPARATTCGHDGDAWVVPPPVNVKAPLNTRPRVTLHADFRERGFCPPWADRSVTKCPKKGTYALELREAGRGGTAGEPIPVEMRESRSNQVATIEMIPKQHLAPNRRYEIRYVEKEAGPIEIVGTFLTGAAIDTTAPSWRGLSSTFQRVGGLWPGETPPRKKPGVITIDMTDCFGLGVEFDALDKATDDQTRPEDIRYAWWMGDVDGTAIDYTTVPLSYTKGYEVMPHFKVVYGTRLEPLNDFSLPTGKKAFKLGVRAVDLAGNMSKPSEVVVRIP